MRRRARRSRRACHASGGSASWLGIRPAKNLFRLAGGDGTTLLDAALPPVGSSTTPPPCVVWVYGGPHFQNVTRSWYVSQEGLRHFLAQCGVAVLVVDNRGAADRGLAFGDRAGRFGLEVEVADQAAAVQQLGGCRPSTAAGWRSPSSYGGFMTLMCLIQQRTSSRQAWRLRQWPTGGVTTQQLHRACRRSSQGAGSLSALKSAPAGGGAAGVAAADPRSD